MARRLSRAQERAIFAKMAAKAGHPGRGRELQDARDRGKRIGKGTAVALIGALLASRTRTGRRAVAGARKLGSKIAKRPGSIITRVRKSFDKSRSKRLTAARHKRASRSAKRIIFKKHNQKQKGLRFGKARNDGGI